MHFIARKTTFTLTILVLLLGMLIPLFIFPNLAGATPTSEGSITGLAAQSPAAVMLNVKNIVININGTEYLFVDNNQYDNERRYEVQNSDCYGVITFDTDQKGSISLTSAKLDMDYKPPNGGCSNIAGNDITISVDSTFGNVWAEYADADTILFYAGGSTESYTKTSVTGAAGTLYARTDKGSCNNLLVVRPDFKSAYIIRLEGNKDNGRDGIDSIARNNPDVADLIQPYFPSSCEVLDTAPWGNESDGNNNFDLPLIGLANATVADPSATGGAPSSGTLPGGGGGTVAETSCEDNEGAFVFIQCELIRWSGKAIDEMDDRVRNALEVNPDYYNDDRLREAWGNFRDIAYLLLIPTMLIMVIGTALGFNFLDAYTVKRAMPRMLAAVIFIALSYEICIFLLEFTTIVGRGVAGLIAQPFGGADALRLENIFSPSNVSGAGLGVGILGGIAIIGVGALSLGIIASYLLVAAVALLIIFVVLTLREMILLFLIVLGPIAVLAWIFPGNDKPWKLWWGSFSKLLMLYPLIIGLLVVGRAFASIMAGFDASGLEGTFITFAKLVAYVGPFFLIPALFKWAGGFFGDLVGKVNDRSRGVFDRQRKYRSDARKRNFQETQAGNRFKGKNAISRRLNTAAQYGSHIGSFSRKEGFAGVRSAANAASSLAVDKQMNDNHEANQLFADDMVARAASESRNASEFRANLQALDRTGRFADPKELNEITAGVEKQRQKMGAQTFAGYTALKAIEGGTAVNTGEAAASVARVVQSNPTMKGAMVAKARSAAMKAGRIEQGAAGFGAYLGGVNEMLAELQQTGDISQATIDRVGENIEDSSADSSGAAQAVYGKPESAEALGRSHLRKINRQIAHARAGTVDPSLRDAQGNPRVPTERDIVQSMASAAGVLDAMGSASPQNARRFADVLTGANIDFTGVTPQLRSTLSLDATGTSNSTATRMPIMDIMDNMRSNNREFREMRREYGSQVTQQAQGQLAAAQANAQIVPGAGALPGQAGGMPQGPTGTSDIRLKRDITYIRTIEGIPMFSFKYLWSDTTYVGTMAQDLLKIMPEAVLVDNSGYYAVNYELLPFDMITLEEYEKNTSKTVKIYS